MLVTVPVEHSKPPQLKAGFGISFRIEFHQMNPIRGHKGDEGNVVLLGHGMGNGNEMLILNGCDAEDMAAVRFLCLLRRQGDSAAADEGVSGAVDDVPADGADVEFTAKHIGGGIFVDDVLAVHELYDRDVQCL